MFMERKVACPKCGAENLAWRSNCSACGETLHPDERKIPTFETRGVGFWIALICGMIGTVAFAFFTVEVVSYSWQYSYFIGLLAVPVISLALCWKWPLATGVIFVISCFLPPAGLWMMVVIDPGESLFMAFGMLFALFLMSAPLLLSGILFITAGRRS